MTPPSADSARDAFRGRILVLLAGVLWSTSGLFAKSPFFDDWPAESRGLVLACWRALFAGLLMLPLVRRPKWTPRLVPSALSFAVMTVTFLSSMVLTTAANTIWLQHTAPAWVFLMGLVLLGERAARRDLVLLIFALSGVGLILAFEIRGQSPLGVALALLSGLTYAGVVVSLRAMRDADNAWVVAVNQLATFALLLPVVAWIGVWPTPGQLVVLACFGIFQMGLPYLLFARALRSIPGHEASVIVLIEPILVPVWVFLAWRHTPTYSPPAWWTLLGGGLILGGLLLRYSVLRRARVAA